MCHFLRSYKDYCVTVGSLDAWGYPHHKGIADTLAAVEFYWMTGYFLESFLVAAVLYTSVWNEKWAAGSDRGVL